MRISDWSSDVCSSDLRPLLYACRPEADSPKSARSSGERRLRIGSAAPALRHRRRRSAGNLHPPVRRAATRQSRWKTSELLPSFGFALDDDSQPDSPDQLHHLCRIRQRVATRQRTTLKNGTEWGRKKSDRYL